MNENITKNTTKDEKSYTYSITNNTDFRVDSTAVATFNPSATLSELMKKLGSKDVKFTIEYQKGQYLLCFKAGDVEGAFSLGTSGEDNTHARLSNAFREVEIQLVSILNEKYGKSGTNDKNHQAKSEVLVEGANHEDIKEDKKELSNLDTGHVATSDLMADATVKLKQAEEDKTKKRTTK